MLDPPHLEAVAELLRQAGLTIAEGAHHFDVDCDRARIWVACRPAYCDRGRLAVNAETTTSTLTIDWADGFPRYYFAPECCASELLAWMGARDLLPGSPGPRPDLSPAGPGPPS